MRLGRMLEAGAQGIMYPRCDDAAEAARGRHLVEVRPARAGGGSTAAIPTCPTARCRSRRTSARPTSRRSSSCRSRTRPRSTNADAIAAVEGVDVLFFGPADFTRPRRHPRPVRPSHRPGRHPAGSPTAAKRAGKHWGMPSGTPERTSELMDLGARFICPRGRHLDRQERPGGDPPRLRPARLHLRRLASDRRARSTTMRRHRVLIIGVGSIGERHLRCFQATGRADVGLVEVDPDAAASRRRALRRRAAFADLEPRLATRRPDMAVVATPAPTHVPLATPPGRGGRPRPDREAAEHAPRTGVDRLQAGRERSGVVARRGLRLPLPPVLRGACAQAIREGRFGRPVELVAVSGQHFPTYRPAYRDDLLHRPRHRRRRDPGRADARRQRRRVARRADRPPRRRRRSPGPRRGRGRGHRPRPGAARRGCSPATA